MCVASASQDQQYRGLNLGVAVIRAGQGSPQAQQYLQQFRQNFQTAHGGQTASALVQQRKQAGG